MIDGSCYCITTENFIYYNFHYTENFIYGIYPEVFELSGIDEKITRLTERMKHRHYTGNLAYPHFWRGSQQEEIDLIELTGEDIQAFEIKYKPQKIHVPKKFSDLYPKASYELVSSENYLEFVTQAS